MIFLFVLAELILDFTCVLAQVHGACADAFGIVREFSDLTADASIVCDLILWEL